VVISAAPLIGPGLAFAQTQPAARQAFADGQALVAAKKPADAADKFQAVVDAEPTFAPGWYALAAARRRAGQCDRAISAYRRYAQLQPDETEPYYGLGLCLREVGDRKGAMDALEKYVELEKRPSSQKWVDHARSVLGELTSLPAPREAPAPGPSPREASTAERKVSTGPSAAAAPYAEAQRLRDSGHVDEAIAKFRQAIAADPTHMTARAALGELLLKMRRDDEAIAVFRNAVDRNPSYPLAWYELAFALRVRGRMSEAVEAYQRYIKLKPTDPDPYFGLGRALQKLGKTQAAVRAYETYVSMEKRPTEQKWVQAAQAQISALGAHSAPTP
jgi:predicted Zn-dependent protease